jgi:hypothetical protein
MYTFFTIIIPILLVLALAFLLAHWGAKRHIGYGWALYFGLLSPVIGSLIILMSKRNTKPIKKRSKLWKPVAIIIGVYGLFIFLGGVNTNINSEISYGNSYSEETEKVDYSNNTIANDLGGNIGRVLGGGILSLTVNIHVYKLMDYRWWRYSKIYSGLILISIAIYILRERRVISIMPEKSLDNSTLSNKQNIFSKETQINPVERKSYIMENSSSESFLKESLLKIREFIMSKKLRYYRYIIYSVIAGFISGWYFKKPNEQTLIDLINQRSIWKKDLLLELFRSSGFFFNKYFHFNWVAFLITALIVFLIFMFLNEKGFRQYIFNKLNFRDENRPV